MLRTDCVPQRHDIVIVLGHSAVDGRISQTVGVDVGMSNRGTNGVAGSGDEAASSSSVFIIESQHVAELVRGDVLRLAGTNDEIDSPRGGFIAFLDPLA